MTKDELLTKLAECAADEDTEQAHLDADIALVEFIADEEVDTAYEAVRKWYA